METGLDLASLTAAVDLGNIIAGFLAMGALMIAPNAAKWAIKKVVSFFGR